ncbi:aminotransferase class V-fold PLP-dependent enzyme [Desulfallas sp. Bu1-1]|uniref:aminotransferase class V-fold PLP-dependent enzyme n=1 Tax=Desulfallas sp. Bu1-1 TaxID=2787620 RepID=UPI0018A0AA4E|nr:aminotransferase class V-fold PLP-dependent enzyme [Desulfallas sp. Bu1-1]MBF7083071.1 aminotransferase class V-fold PLP-dependent enzyme [Desulfallas sp. Bu1-1]
MIYFDNAATSWPKPPEVMEAMRHCLEEVGANPGRSGHKMSLAAGKIVDATREAIAALFNISEPDRVIFTFNATDALNMAIKGTLNSGDHVITTSMEHNSVTRPLYGLRHQIEVTKVQCKDDGTLDLRDVKKAIRPNTRAIIMTHASNVSGTVMPVREAGALAREAGIIFIVDAAQTAGILDIDVEKMKIDLLAMPGHKGLMGPPGTGVLYVGERAQMKPFREGGTGSKSAVAGQPEELPEKYESGTLNSVGIAGLGAGVNFIRKISLSKIREHERMLTARFIQGARKIPGLKIFGPDENTERAPVVSFLLEGKDTGAVGGALDRWYNIACRAGLHCSPDAHRTLGTFESKLVRFSFSYFNQVEEVDFALQCLRDIKERDLSGVDGGCNC